MSMTPGTRLGPYEVLSVLGAGGMGEVYQARDQRLGREVAIKVLPAHLASDPERLRRFELEARSASALNHPNIVTIYDVGSADATSYLAMELVAGTTLRQLASEHEGGLPAKKLLQIAAQVADGLARAHAAGIVHRDLKPENIMVTEDGLAKILDFGLAKLTPEDASSAETRAPLASGATELGVVMGTVGYMSPEQALGKAVDFRSDQFSFGSILYELGTGRAPFLRGSAAETLTAVIREEPEPITAVNARIPAPLRWSIERCLAKEARNRFASTEDLARDLATIRDHLSELSGSIEAIPVVAERMPQRRWWIPVAIALGILLMLGISYWQLLRHDYFWVNPLAGARYTRFSDWEGSEFDAAISADGKFVAFVSDRDGPFDAWVGQIGSGEFLNVSKGRFLELANRRIRNVGFSDDGAHVWLMEIKGADAAVWLVPTMGGVPRPFLPTAAEVAWSPDRSRILYHSPAGGDPIFIADRNGENPRQIFIDKPGIHNHYPTWSPDGRFVYFVRGVPPFMDLWRIASAGGVPERLTYHDSRVAYPTLLDPRTLIYTAVGEDGGSGLYAMDVERRIPHAVSSGLEEYLSVAASADGRQLVATVANPVRNLWTVPISDHVVDDSGLSRFSLPTVRATAPRFGPDYLLYLSSKGGADGLWKWKDGSALELWRGSDGAVAAAPAISPDGAQIAFTVRSERVGLYLMASDGTGAHRIADSLDVRDAPSWSPDGKWIAVVASEGQAIPLFKVPVDGGPPVRLAEGITSDPLWSPDGRLILYSEGQAAMLSLRGVTPDGQPFPLPNVSVRYTGNRYRFLPDGKRLVVMQGLLWQQNFMLLDLETGGQRQLTNLRGGFGMQGFDVSPDGKKILFDQYRENSDVVLIDLPR